MTWIFDKPLATLSDKAKNDKDCVLWEAEDLGGMTEDNNRVPVPIVWLLLLTVLTAFAITFPLWGQRPTAAIYKDYVAAMDSAEVVGAKDDEAAMKVLWDKFKNTENQQFLERHPLTMDDLRTIKPQIEALQKKGVDLKDYTVVGPEVVVANFEGNFRADGTRIRQQPWWDKGYTIDVFYVIAFFIGVTMVIKRLPPSTWTPKHGPGH
jgi:hypothetical protein